MRVLSAAACLAFTASPASAKIVEVIVQAANPPDVQLFRFARATDFDALGTTPTQRLAALQNSKFDSDLGVGSRVKVEAGQAYRFVPVCGGKLRLVGPAITIGAQQTTVAIRCRA